MAKSNAPTGKATRAGARSTTARRPVTRNASTARVARPIKEVIDDDGLDTDLEIGVRRRVPAKPAARRPPKFPKAVAGAVQAALDKKAEDVVVLDLRKAGGFTDFFVICTGGNPRQINAIADGVRDTLKREFDERPALSEGVDRSEWILLDYFNFVVHVFSRDCRAFYGLERLWGNAERHEFKDAPPDTLKQ
jgi:ribosome-associated protein